MSKYGITQTDFGWSNIVHTLQCPACDFQTLRPDALQEHCTRSHRSLRRIVVFSCPLCHARSTDVRLIDEHKRLYHTTDSVQAFASSNASAERRGRAVATRNEQPAPSADVATARRKREPSASTSSHVASESSEDCSVLRRTVRKSSIRAIAAMTSPNLVPKESDTEEGAPLGGRRSSGDSGSSKPAGGEASPPEPSGSGLQAKSQREGRLHPAVRAHMDVLFSRGVRRPDDMAAQLRRFVKAEFSGGVPEQLQPSMWSVRRLLKAMSEEEVLPAAHPKRARINLTSPPPAERAHSSPLKSSSSGEQRPRKIFTSSDGPERVPVVKLEENHVELVRCLKCGVRVPFHSDGTRAAQDAALMAHLANSHGIRKREPIVYPAARQRSQSAQGHVTDLDAEAEEVRILKESGVLPAAVTSSAVQVKLEGDEEVRLTGARIQASSPGSAKPQGLKRPPEEEEEEVALVAVRLKEPAVKEPPSERQQIDLDSLNTSSASTAEPPKVAETFELVAEFSEIEKEEEASDQEGGGASPDELTRWATEAMDVDEAGNSKVDDGVEKNDVEPKQSDLETKENDLEPEKSDLETKENDLETKENDLEPEKSDLETKESDLEPEKSDLETKENDLESEKNDLETKENDLEPEKIDLETKESDLETKSNDDLDHHVANDLERKASGEPRSEEEEESICVVREAKQKMAQPEEWQCRHCFAGFEDEQELKSHVEDIHSQ